MSKSLRELNQRRIAIHDILLNEWDPIGVSEFPEAQNEYAGYVGAIDTLVARGAHELELFALLWRIETDIMGLTGNREKTKSIAKRLFDLE